MSDLKDMKEALTGAAKPDTTHVRLASMVHQARAQEYGSAKYVRANYLRAPRDNADLFDRLRVYLRAQSDHARRVLDAMEKHQANDPHLEDIEGMRAAVGLCDTEPGKDGYPPSGLPHLSHSLASGAMGVCIAVEYGMLCDDPGQPWAERSAEAPVTQGAELPEWRPRIEIFVETSFKRMSLARTLVLGTERHPIEIIGIDTGSVLGDCERLQEVIGNRPDTRVLIKDKGNGSMLPHLLRGVPNVTMLTPDMPEWENLVADVKVLVSRVSPAMPWPEPEPEPDCVPEPIDDEPTAPVRESLVAKPTRWQELEDAPKL